MKQEELMIGDWVRWKEDNSFLCIRCSPSLEGCKLFEPIPITTEILGKNGFKKDVHNCSVYYDWLNLDGDDVTLRRYPCGYFELHITDNENLRNIRCPIAYVHELQHALKLCGIDKEIKL